MPGIVIGSTLLYTLTVHFLISCIAFTTLGRFKAPPHEIRYFRNHISEFEHTTARLARSSDQPFDALEGVYPKVVKLSEYVDKDAICMKGLMENLTQALDEWILSGSSTSRNRINDLFELISHRGTYKDEVKLARRRIQRVGLSLPPSVPTVRIDEKKRERDVADRIEWEGVFQCQAHEAGFVKNTKGDSNTVREVFPHGIHTNTNVTRANSTQGADSLDSARSKLKRVDTSINPLIYASESVARAGAGSAFSGANLGIGGLDGVLLEVKRRVWLPLAVPPALLRELGVQPVRGVLLFGPPGCGKTLLAKKLGKILSPFRPCTVVSGPEVMDKFVGSSEKNLRAIFDNPPNVKEGILQGETDGGEHLSSSLLHVVIMDEFDALARSRGGLGESGQQGDAGIARDSVVNQLLAKMDGVNPMPVPTIVIALTNKKHLIDAALLRPGRFEVQIEVPPPKSALERRSILRIHTSTMQQSGRILVSDAPIDTPASEFQREKRICYDELLVFVANKTTGFSGAGLAGVCRAAASRALERAVNLSNSTSGQHMLQNCIVTQSDFTLAIEDVRQSGGVVH